MNQSKKSRRIREKAVDNGIKHWIFHCALFIVIWSLFAVSVSASTISRPMSNSGLVGYWSFVSTSIICYNEFYEKNNS